MDWNNVDRLSANHIRFEYRIKDGRGLLSPWLCLRVVVGTEARRVETATVADASRKRKTNQGNDTIRYDIFSCAQKS